MEFFHCSPSLGQKDLALFVKVTKGLIVFDERRRHYTLAEGRELGNPLALLSLMALITPKVVAAMPSILTQTEFNFTK